MQYAKYRAEDVVRRRGDEGLSNIVWVCEHLDRSIEYRLLRLPDSGEVQGLVPEQELAFVCIGEQSITEATR